jgi:hypothetical protein
VKVISQYSADDYMWGIPESPEISMVHRLTNEFKTHESDEERCLSVYRKMAEDSGDPMFRFLFNLIIADEERHHQLIGRMISSLSDDLNYSRTRVPAPPTVNSRAAARELEVMIERFLEIERKGIRECEKLKKTSQQFRQDLLALLCQTMVFDSLKHVGILNFLRRKLKQQKVRAAKKRTHATERSPRTGGNR